MENIQLVQALVGNITEKELESFDCYVRSNLGVFIPIFPETEEVKGIEHKHPAYEVVIYFGNEAKLPKHYCAEIISPDVVHEKNHGMHYYSLMINKEYFEERYLLYADEIPVYRNKKFEFCSDILQALNTFAFEYNKSMMNSNITLDAQTEIITHWLIRSIFGETLDMRAVSADYSVARAQHYMEQHYMENVTVAKLAELGYVSPSVFNRRFKKEIGITPIEYLIEIRIKRAKIMLRRKDISITDIAIRCGFGSSAHFATCFQNHVGVTPTEYRNKY